MIDDGEAQKKLQELEIQKADAEKKVESIQKEEKLQSWNVDTISKDGFSKSSINKQLPRKQQDMSEEEREEKMKKFVQENQKDLKAFGWLSKMDDSKGAKCIFVLHRLCTIAMSNTADLLILVIRISLLFQRLC